MKPTGARNKHYLAWDKAAIIAALHARQEQGLEMHYWAVHESDLQLSAAIGRYFGSFDEALRAAGVAARRRVEWDKASVVAALRARRDKGLGTGIGAIQKSQPGLSSAIYRLFGSHNHARAAAGVDPERRGRPPTWDHSAVVAALRSRRDKGLGTGVGAIHQSQPGLSGAIYRLFGSHSHALSAAGMEPVRQRRAGVWNQPAVLVELRRRHTSGKPLSSTLLRRQNAPLFNAAARLFGSYRKALAAAGIDPASANASGRVDWPTHRILDGLRDYYARWWRTHSRDDPPRPRLTGADPELVSAARGRFGGVLMALQAAGIDDPIVPPRLLWPPDKILAALRKASRDGTLSYRMCSRTDTRLSNAAARRFGSLRNAAAAAGLRYVRAPHRSQRRRGGQTDPQLVIAPRPREPMTGGGASEPEKDDWPRKGSKDAKRGTQAG